MDFKEYGDLLNGIAQNTAEFRKRYDEAIDEVKKQLTDLSGDLTKQLDGLTQEALKKQNDDISAMCERQDKLDLLLKRMMNRSQSSNSDELPEEQKDHHEAIFGKKGYLRLGANPDSFAEIKSLSSYSDPDGGYLITPFRSRRITTIIQESSPVRQYATVETIGTTELQMLVDLDQMAVTRGNEVSYPASQATPTIRELKISVWDMSVFPMATVNMLNDSDWDIESWLQRKAAGSFARAEAYDFINGDGTNCSRGLLKYPAGTSWGQIEQINSGSSAAVTADLIIKLEGALKADYRNGAAYFMNRTVENKVRQMKDGQNNYLWQPSYQLGTPRTLNGYPYGIFNDLPNESANALPILFGNLGQAYTIVEREGIRILKNPYAVPRYIRWEMTRRVGGGVTNFEAIKIGKCST